MSCAKRKWSIRWRGEWSGYSNPLKSATRSSTVGRSVARTEAKLMIMSGCHLRHLSFRASTIPSFPSTPHGRTILSCMPSLSFVPRIYLFLLLEYLPVVLLKPFLSYRPRFFTNSSTFPSSSSTYQRTDRRRHSTSDLFRIFRWSSCPPQRHAYPTLCWKRTFFFSHSPSSLRLSFLPLFTIIPPSCAADAPPPVPLRCQHSAGASPPFRSQPSRFTFIT